MTDAIPAAVISESAPIEGGFYEVRPGMGIYIDPKTKEFTSTYP